jgi:hypothetical protein
MYHETGQLDEKTRKKWRQLKRRDTNEQQARQRKNYAEQTEAEENLLFEGGAKNVEPSFGSRIRLEYFIQKGARVDIALGAGVIFLLFGAEPDGAIFRKAKMAAPLTFATIASSNFFKLQLDAQLLVVKPDDFRLHPLTFLLIGLTGDPLYWAPGAEKTAVSQVRDFHDLTLPEEISSIHHFGSSISFSTN